MSEGDNMYGWAPGAGHTVAGGVRERQNSFERRESGQRKREREICGLRCQDSVGKAILIDSETDRGKRLVR